MQSNGIKFMALIFIALALCTITSAIPGRFGDNSCECAGGPRWTTHCCEESRGLLRSGRCHQGFGNRFQRCCEVHGLRHACFT